MSNKRKNTAMVAMYAVLLVFITYYISIGQLEEGGSDFWGHTYTYIPLLKGDSGAGGWMAVPYFMWHLVTIGLHALGPIPIKAAAAFSSCFFAALGFYVIYWMIERISQYYDLKITESWKGFFAFGLSIVQPVYMYWFDSLSQYLGQFSINPLHNPTQMCVKPFSLICLGLTFDILQKFYDPKHQGVFVSLEKGLKKAYVMLSVTLLLSCMAKPTFAEMFIPAVGLFMLFEWLKQIFQKKDTAKIYFQKCMTMLLVSVPALLYILLQFLAYFIWGGSYGVEEGSLVITEWMQVWRMFSENIVASIALGMGFPLLIVLFNGAYFVKSVMGRLALIGYGVGLLECALLGEGEKLAHGDFLWPMMSGMTLLWIVSFLRFLVISEKECNTKKQEVFVHAAWFVFFAYVAFGIIFIYGMLAVK